MKLIEFNRNPTDRQLKQFGIAGLVFLPFIGWLVMQRPRSFDSVNLPLLVVLVLIGVQWAVLAFMRPKALRHVFVGAILVTLPIGLVVGEAVLLLVFFGLFAPLGLLFRMIGRDALQRQFDRGAATYWQPKQQPESLARYYRQF